MNINELKFYNTPMQRVLLLNKIRENSTLRRIIKRNKIINDMINFEIEHRINGLIDNFLTIIVRGEQGTLKTSSSLGFSVMLDPLFNINNVAFLYENFKNKLSNSQPRQAFNLDELVFIHGAGSTRIVQEIQSLIETLRKRQNSMIITCTMEKYFPEEVFTFVMETIDNTIIGTCKKNKILHEVRTCEYHTDKEHIIKEVYIRLAVKKNNEYLGLYILRQEWNNQLWKDYCKIKDDFLEKAKNQLFEKISYDDMANKILKLPESSLYKKKTGIKLLIEKVYPNLTMEERNLLAEQISIIRETEQE